MDVLMGVRLGLVFVLLLFSAFFSAAEVALFSLSRLQLETLREKHGAAGALVASLLEKPRRLLVTIYIGNELVNVAIAAVITVVALQLFSSYGMAAAVGVATFVVLVFGEITPKSFALKYAERYSLWAARPLAVFARIIYPVQTSVTWLTNRMLGSTTERGTDDIAGITEDEIKTMLDHGEDKGVIEPVEKEMILNVFKLGDTTAIDVMTPRTEIRALDMDDPLPELRKLALNSNFSRIPVYAGNIDHIEGILYTKDLMAPDKAGAVTAREIIRQPYFIPPTKKLDELLREFRKRKIHMAVIVDEYGGVEGLVTLEDILEHVVGDAATSAAAGVVQLSPGRFQMPGRMELEKFNELFGVTLQHDDIDTVGGYVFHLFGRMPRWGESVDHDRFTFTVQKLKGPLISQLLVVVREEPADGAGGER